MDRCEFAYPDADGTTRRCPRPVHADADRCPFHLPPAERRAAGVSAADLREAVRADVAADDDRRREYVDVTLDELDLSAMVLDGEDVGRIAFREVTVDGDLDLSGAVLRHPVTFENCRIGRLDATRATFADDVAVEGGTFGGGAATCLRCRRASFGGSLHLSGARFEGSLEFAACRVEGWLDVDGVAVAGRADFPNASLGTAQFVDATFEGAAEFGGLDGEHVTFEGARFASAADFAGATLGTLRARPAGDAEFRFAGATVAGGRLLQPDSGTALYDLTRATVGDVELDCDADSFDRYRFYRTRFEGFPFASYRRLLRANRWRLHGYAGTPAETADVEGLEITYLQAKQGASGVGDNENASAFFVRELRYRRGRYAAHLRDGDHALGHRVDAGLRWLTNGFLGLVAGYGERPQRIVLASLAVIVGAALTYPATAGLDAGSGVVTYASDGAAAAVDGLYFSVVTFATLGLGDVHPVGDVGRLLAASEALAGAFLTALFVFSLGRRVTR